MKTKLARTRRKGTLSGTPSKNFKEGGKGDRKASKVEEARVLEEQWGHDGYGDSGSLVGRIMQTVVVVFCVVLMCVTRDGVVVGCPCWCQCAVEAILGVERQRRAVASGKRW